MTLSRFNLSGGSAGHGGLVLVDEDTGLFHNRGKVNRHSIPTRNGHLDNQRGEPEESSTPVDDNITTDKKADCPFPGKPSASVTNLVLESEAKTPSLGFSKLPGILTDRVNVRMEAPHEMSKLAFRDSPLIVSVPSGDAFPQSWRSVISDHRAKDVTKLVDKDDSHWRTTESRYGRLIQGSDGRMYRLQRGPPGLMGPPGEDVSPSFIFSV